MTKETKVIFIIILSSHGKKKFQLSLTRLVIMKMTNDVKVVRANPSITRSYLLGEFES